MRTPWRRKPALSPAEIGRSGTAGQGHTRFPGALIIGETAVALVLVIAWGLLLRSFENMRAVDLGYRPEQVLVAGYSLPQKQYATQSAIDQFNHELIRRLEQIPIVKFAGLTSSLPASGNTNNSTFIAVGYVAPPGAGLNLATIVTVEGNYLEAMGIPLRRGRYFMPADTGDAQLVAIVNRKLAEHYWPGADPIGKRLRIGIQETPLHG